MSKTFGKTDTPMQHIPFETRINHQQLWQCIISDNDCTAVSMNAKNQQNL